MMVMMMMVMVMVMVVCAMWLQVKQQHLDNNTQFLAEELQVVDKREAKDRVFFVSAREALVSRLQNDSGVATPGMYRGGRRWCSSAFCCNSNFLAALGVILEININPSRTF